MDHVAAPPLVTPSKTLAVEGESDELNLGAEPAVFLSPGDLEELGVDNGGPVEISTDDRRLFARAYTANEELSPGLCRFNGALVSRLSRTPTGVEIQEAEIPDAETVYYGPPQEGGADAGLRLKPAEKEELRKGALDKLREEGRVVHPGAFAKGSKQKGGGSASVTVSVRRVEPGLIASVTEETSFERNR